MQVLKLIEAVRRDGFNITLQPAAIAGTTLRVIIAFGKFQGVIAAEGPIPVHIA
ncbi:hypothetical protein A1E_03065 [Rickettsia canadensis str. McKiel]|uniref:Uncharacterized protein n=1 Tax=Rickettsia canadensis (strain McKiel) TaxID=293613 RepID=A8EYW7_RICCK|nr:hypothetical protein A1E_03065 [Rickettsia canadensis str. McKiel]